LAPLDPKALAAELAAAYASGQTVSIPPSARDAGFDLAAAYAVEAELAQRRRAEGRTTVGRKVGFANKAVWRVLKLDTLVWARLYDDTVRYAADGAASFSLTNRCSPKIEPEIVFKLRRPLGAEPLEPGAVLSAVEWIALGFEIIDCVFPDWKFQPADFVAAYGLHVGLIVGEPMRVDAARIPTLAETLAKFTVGLVRNGELVEEGSGKNSLRSPALCLGELARAIACQTGAEPLDAGELVSSGTLTESKPIAPGETWTAILDGLDLPELTLRMT